MDHIIMGTMGTMGITAIMGTMGTMAIMGTMGTMAIMATMGTMGITATMATMAIMGITHLPAHLECSVEGLDLAIIILIILIFLITIIIMACTEAVPAAVLTPTEGGFCNTSASQCERLPVRPPLKSAYLFPYVYGTMYAFAVGKTLVKIIAMPSLLPIFM
ncbi:uncharacterized protein LOC143825753 [Paroedura picta]|uniref:uncharacterized protein LOC143825753 n=1 Tax=Paroedura picta TaxID=143630 RepID=UPI0040577470